MPGVRHIHINTCGLGFRPLSKHEVIISSLTSPLLPSAPARTEGPNNAPPCGRAHGSSGRLVMGLVVCSRYA